MKRTLIAILATGFLISPVFAAEAPVKPAGPPSTGLTLNDCLLILQATRDIDEHLIVLGTAPNQQLVKQSYQYTASPGFRMNFLAHNIRILTTIQQDAQAEQQKIHRDILAKIPQDKLADEVGKDGKPTGKKVQEIPAGSPEAAEYDEKLKTLTAAPCVADLAHFKETDLNLGVNDLPASALVNIEKIRDK